MYAATAPPPILVFRSARPGWSFETWLFQRLTPRDRRALTAAITVNGRHWTSDAAPPGSPGVEVMLLRAGQRSTQRELASLTGIPQSTVSEIESGLANPTLANLAEIAHALGCSVGLGITAGIRVEPGG